MTRRFLGRNIGSTRPKVQTAEEKQYHTLKREKILRVKAKKEANLLPSLREERKREQIPNGTGIST